jgi:hypothetical protein
VKTSKYVVLSALVASVCGAAQAAPVVWADWTSGVSGSTGSAKGFFDLDTDITIDYTGESAFIQTNGGAYYYTGVGYVSPAVDNGPSTTDIIALSRATPKTLSFSAPIDNLFFAVVSLNGNGYEFDEDFTIESFACGYWGCGTLTRQDMGNGKYRLIGSGEPHGVIRFKRAVSSITWTSLTNEYWNGFTVGTYGAAPPIPEPSTYALLALGLGGVVFAARRRKQQQA